MSAPVFITGGSSGIGLELAKIFARRGDTVAIFARDASRLQDAVQVLKSIGPEARIAAYPVDVGSREATEQVMRTAIAELGVPGWAIANAGIAEPGLFLEQDLDTHDAQMRANYLGALYFAKTLASPMANAGGGRMVFVSSGAAFFGITGYSAYAPSKFAMRGLAEVLRVELAPDRIAVSLVYPPDTDTPMLAYEETMKPAESKVITAGGGLWSAADVAALIVRKAEKGRFAITPGFQMRALLILSSLIAPLLRLWQSWVIRRHRG